MKLKKWIRRLAFLLIALAVLVAVLYFVIQRRARQQVVAALEELVGGRVEVDDIRLGGNQIEIRGLRAYEADSDDTIWLTIDRLVLDLTLNDALRGETVPESAKIQRAKVVLKYDEQGNLLTGLRLAKPGGDLRLGHVDVSDTTVEIHQTGRVPLILTKIDGEVQVEGQEIQIQAVVGDALNTRWNLNAVVQRSFSAANCKIVTETTHVSTDEFARLPFFPQGLSKELRASGSTPIELDLQLDETSGLTYRLALSPRSMDIDLVRANLSATDAAGSIALQNDQVAFTDLRGTMAGGRFSVDGLLRSHDDAWRGQLQVTFGGMPLAHVPKAWRMPGALRGIVSGQGNLSIELTDSHTQLRSTANATIDDAEWAGIPVRPVSIELQDAQIRKLSDGDDWTLDGDAKVDLEIADVQFAELFKAANVQANAFEDLTGMVGLQAALQIRLATAGDPRTYRAAGKLRSRRIQFRDISLSDAEADFQYQDGIASIRNLDTKVAATGRLQGSLDIEVQPRGVVVADVEAEALPVSLIANLIEIHEPALSGVVSGRVRASAPLEDWNNSNLWQADGRLASAEIAWPEQRLTSVDASFNLRQDRLEITRGSARWHDAELSAAGELRIRQPYAYSVTLSASNVDVDSAAQLAAVELPVNVIGKAKLNAAVTGQLEPFAWKASGDVRLERMIFERLKLDSPSAKWQADSKGLKVTDAEAELLGGTVKFEAAIPFDKRSPTELAGTFAGIDSQVARQHVPQFLSLSGEASGQFSLTGIENLETATGMVNVRGLAAELHGVAVDDLAIELSLLRQRVDLSATGAALGGSVSLSGAASLDELSSPSPVIPAKLTAEAVMVSQIWDLIGDQVRMSPPEGTANLQLDLRLAGPDFKPTGSGRVMVQDLRWQGKSLSSQVATGVTLLSDSLVLSDLSFDYGGGRVSGTLHFRLDQPGSGSYSLVAQGVSLRSALVAYPDLARQATGSVSAAFRGRFAGLRLDGAGKVQITSGQLAGVSIRRCQASVTWAYDVPNQRGKADVRVSRGEIARGRSSGNLSIRWGRTVTLDGKASFSDLDMRPLVLAMPMLTDRLDGRLSGTIAFQGRNVRSLGDVSGTFDLQIANSPMLRLPVLSALTFATGIGSSSRTFSTTEIKGRKNRGIIDIERMTMVEASVHIFLSGTITTRGQLDLEVIADTGELLAIGVAASFIRPLDWLRRRLIFLHIGGTIRSPVVLPQTEKFIQQEALLFFLPLAGFDTSAFGLGR